MQIMLHKQKNHHHPNEAVKPFSSDKKDINFHPFPWSPYPNNFFLFVWMGGLSL